MAIPREVQKQADQAKAAQAQFRGDPAEPAKPDADPPSDEEQVDWEKRFKGLKKAHDTEITELRNAKDSLEGKIAQLEELLEKAKTVEPAAQEPIFTPEEVEEYGEDFLKMVQRAAERIAKPNGSEDVASQLKELREQFNGIVQHQVRSEKEMFYDALDKAVPDWEQINEDKGFHAWLAEEMPLTGKERQVFLVDAQEKLDADAVIRFFTAWKGESGKQSYFPDTRTNSNELGDTDASDTEIYTQKQIEGFYRDKKLGRYRGKEDEARQIELKIFRAQKEGRVR